MLFFFLLFLVLFDVFNMVTVGCSGPVDCPGLRSRIWAVASGEDYTQESLPKTMAGCTKN